MLLDHFIDDLLCLQNRFPGLIWRLWEEQGVCIEFFLEELAFDCAANLVMSGTEVVYLAQSPRVVRIPFPELPQKSRQVMSALTAFLGNIVDQSANSAGNSNPASHDEEIVI